MTVGICKQHEDSSLKTIKKAASKQSTALKKLEEVAANLGYKLVPINDAAEESRVTQRKPEAPREAGIPVKEDHSRNRTISLPSPKVSASSEIGASMAPHRVDVKDESGNVPRDQIVEAQTLTTATRKVVLPKRMVGNTGQTDIVVVQTNDAMLDRETEKQFKAYGVKECSVCNSQGVLAGGKQCPRCGGKGMIT